MQMNCMLFSRIDYSRSGDFLCHKQATQKETERNYRMEIVIFSCGKEASDTKQAAAAHDARVKLPSAGYSVARNKSHHDIYTGRNEVVQRYGE